VRDAPATLLDASAGHPVERLRQRVRDAIYAHVADRRAAGVLAALAIGDQGAIERDDWDLFRNTGVAHLMSISGLHVTMFAWLAGALIGAAWRRSTRAMRRLPAPSAARWGGLGAATAYAFFAGWGVPSQRTVWMLATVTLLQAGGLRWPWALVLLAAAFVVTVVDPWALTQAGFWLSFMAVGLLMASSPATGAAPEPGDDRALGWRGWPKRFAASIRGGLRTQVTATLGLTPLTLVFFQQVSLVGFLANLVAIPLVTLVITPLALVGIALAPLWSLAAAIVQGLDALLAGLASVPGGAVWSVGVAPVWAQVAGLLAAVLVVLPLPRRAKLVAVPLALGLLVPPASLPSEGNFDVVAADIGQGTAGTRCSSTAGRSTRARATPASASWCRCCAAGARRSSICSSSATATAITSAARARCSARSRSTPCRVRSRMVTRCSRRRTIRSAASPASAGAGTASISPSSPPPPTTMRARFGPTPCRACCASPAVAAASCSPATSSASRSRRWSPRTATACEPTS
jgi:competence protein ComEC